ncbi:hypothetical protein [Streptomyces cinereoruber]|uniref:hypothetical protein n=1 Tax=Streptomyces cinereoruber TaxID=67260 RepID=UPI003C2D051E
MTDMRRTLDMVRRQRWFPWAICGVGAFIAIGVIDSIDTGTTDRREPSATAASTSASTSKAISRRTPELAYMAGYDHAKGQLANNGAAAAPSWINQACGPAEPDAPELERAEWQGCADAMRGLPVQLTP